MVEMRRVELLTPCLQGRCSSQLSYTPINEQVFSCLPFDSFYIISHHKTFVKHFIQVFKKIFILCTFLIFNYNFLQNISIICQKHTIFRHIQSKTENCTIQSVKFEMFPFNPQKVTQDNLL